MNKWHDRKCVPCEGKTTPMREEEVRKLLPDLPGWTLNDGALGKTFAFKNYYETTAFVNAVAWIAHGQDHHPDISFGYKQCTIRYVTHAIGGISSNDFICAAKVNALLE